MTTGICASLTLITKTFTAYLDMVFGIRDMKSNIDTAASVTADDKIITLSTCYAGMDNRRYLVQAVLVSIEQ